MPSFIIEGTPEIKASFIRGLADADFCLTIKHKPNKYPVIQGAAKSDVLMKQVKQMLNELGIASCCIKEIGYSIKRNKIYTSHRVYINGPIRIKKYLQVIGFSNQRYTIE